MRTRMIQVTGQTVRRLQKFTEKNDYPSESLCNSCYADRQKSECFFFKNEWSLNKFQCNFKSNYVQVSFFSQFFLCFSVKNTQKCTSLKLYLKNQFIFSLPNSFWSTTPKSRLPQRRKQISQHACEKTKNVFG